MLALALELLLFRRYVEIKAASVELALARRQGRGGGCTYFTQLTTVDSYLLFGVDHFFTIDCTKSIQQF